MKTYKFNYIVNSERLSYIYAESKEEAESKLMKMMQEYNERDVIKKIEENYVQTLNEGHVGINFGSISEVEDIDNF